MDSHYEWKHFCAWMAICESRVLVGSAVPALDSMSFGVGGLGAGLGLLWLPWTSKGLFQTSLSLLEVFSVVLCNKPFRMHLSITIRNSFPCVETGVGGIGWGAGGRVWGWGPTLGPAPLREERQNSEQEIQGGCKFGACTRGLHYAFLGVLRGQAETRKTYSKVIIGFKIE